MSQFEAEIHKDNLPSEAIVSRLGFTRHSPDSGRERYLELVAPPLIRKWILPCDARLMALIEKANLDYSEKPRRSLHRPSSSQQYSQLIGILAVAAQVEDTEITEDLGKDNIQEALETARVIEEKIFAEFSRHVPTNVPRDDFRSLSWIGPADIQGFWNEGEAGVLWLEKIAIKGYQQIIVLDQRRFPALTGYETKFTKS